jgi:hypothetical protein
MNVAVNCCYLITVRRTLGLLPYNMSYLKLLLPSAGMLSVLFAVREVAGSGWPPWLTVGAALALAYLVFIVIALIFGLNVDDKVIARAIWARISGMIRADATS